MGSCYSGDHIAEDHIYMDIATCINEEPQHKYRLGTKTEVLRHKHVTCNIHLTLKIFLLRWFWQKEKPTLNAGSITDLFGPK